MSDASPHHPPPSDHRPLLRALLTLVLVGVALIALGLLLGLTLVGRHGGGAIQGLDRRTGNWFLTHRYLVGVAKVVATFGDAAALGIICLVLTIGLLIWRRSPVSLVPIVGFLGGEAFVFLIRQVIHRPRPITANGSHALSGIHETSWSFPSGHATTVTAVLFACLGAVALARRTVWPWLLALLASLYVASTRLVLGVHWLSDVSVGLLLGLLWGVTVAVVATRLSWDELRYLVPARRNERPRQAVDTTTSLSGPPTGP